MKPRRCSRPACKQAAVHTLTYVYRDSTAVLGPLAAYVEPHCYDLCAAHADRMTVPIGWVAVGDPASILPPDQHDRIWAVQEPLNFPESVYGLNRSTPDLMIEITRSLSETLGSHSGDVVHKT